MTTTSVKDPVCGMTVEANAAAAQSDYKGQTYYFCCGDCKKQFDQAPQKYLAELGGAPHSGKCGCGC